MTKDQDIWAKSQSQPVPRYIWAMAMSRIIFGAGSGLFLLTIPQLLADRHVPVPIIADISALGLIASVGCLFLAPLLDVGFSRRFYAVALALLTAGLGVFALASLDNLPMLRVAVVALALSTSLYTEAFSGWLGASLPKSANNSLSAWFNVANGLGFGLAALLFYPVLTRFSGWLGLGLVGLMLLVPLLVLPIMPSPDAGRSGMRESFGRLGTDVWHLLRKPAMLRLMLLFTAPCAAFALTNVFGGIGADFHSSPEWVGFANGPLNMVVGLCVPLLARPILARVEPVVFYLVVGAVGALVTLGLIVLPRTPEVYMLAVVLENIFQMAAFSAEITIKFRSIAPGSPLASTQSALIGSAVTLPLAAMQSFDGQGYGMAGIAGAFGMDAALSLLACAVLVVPVLRWSRRAQLTI